VVVVTPGLLETVLLGKSRLVDSERSLASSVALLAGGALVVIMAGGVRLATNLMMKWSI